MINVNASFKAYDRVWLHVGRHGEERLNEFPAGGRCKSVYVIELPDGEMIEQCIVRPQEVRPPGKGWSLYGARKRFTVWRRPRERERGPHDAR